MESLKLQLNPEKTGVTHFDQGFTFLGSLFLRSLTIPGVRDKDIRIQVPKTPPLEQPVITTDETLRLGPSDVSTEAEIHSAAASEPLETEPQRPRTIGPLFPGFTPSDTLADAFEEALDEKGITLDQFKANLAEEVHDDDEDLPEAAYIEAIPDPSGKYPQPSAPDALKLKPVLFLRTLYVQEQGVWIRIEGERFRITREAGGQSLVLLEVLAIKIAQMLLMGSILVTPAVTRFCLTRNIPITFSSQRGAYYGRLESTRHVNTIRERIQFSMTGSEGEFRRLELATDLIDQLEADRLRQFINRGVRAALYHDRSEKLAQMALLLRSGHLEQLSQEDFRHGRRFRVFK